jgi:hypothetical protein
VLVPTAAQADSKFYESPIFGIANGPDGSLFVADGGQGIVDADTGRTSAFLPGVNDVAPIGTGEALAVRTSEDGTGVYRISRGRTQIVADTAAYEAGEDPAGDGTDEGSNPFDLARMNGGKALVADAAGNSLLVVDERGRLDWVASFPTELVSTSNAKTLFGCPAGPPDICNLPPMIPAQPVPTSVAIGPDGAYYVGELKGFPSPTGESRVWRIEPGSRHVVCGSSPKCTIALDGLTSIIDLAFGPDGRLNVAQLDDASWFALELGQGVGGSVKACNLTTKTCSTSASGVPILTSIAYRGSALWGSILGLVPGQADVVPLAPFAP